MRFIPISLVLALGACAFKQPVPASKSLALQSQEEGITRDYVVEGTVVANEIGPEYRRLILRPDSHLVTEGRGLEIQVDEIVGEGGVIESFPENQQAEFGKEGRPSGSIHIQARTAQGPLLIRVRGERGGQGLPGAKGANGAPGNPGADAVFRNLGAIAQCMKSAENGGPGGNGAQGDQGHPGFSGGDANSILIEIEEESSVELMVDFLPGEGGEGGTGGAGGDAGLGGLPGKAAIDLAKFTEKNTTKRMIEICTEGKTQGPSGAAGTVGLPGPQGAMGMKGSLCGFVGTKVLGVGCQN